MTTRGQCGRSRTLLSALCSPAAVLQSAFLPTDTEGTSFGWLVFPVEPSAFLVCPCPWVSPPTDIHPHRARPPVCRARFCFLGTAALRCASPLLSSGPPPVSRALASARPLRCHHLRLLELFRNPFLALSGSYSEIFYFFGDKVHTNSSFPVICFPSTGLEPFFMTWRC